jgi:nitrogen fixation protein NifX
MENGWRVAVASTDGDAINAHFGRARSFCIFDIVRDGSVALLEKRVVTAAPEGAGHSDAATLEKINILGDCAAVLAEQIGPGARRLLAINRIAALEVDGDIAATLDKLARYFIRTNFNPLPGI